MKNLVGFVTGGASGLGRATVIKLLHNGMRIVSLDKNFCEDFDENHSKLISETADTFSIDEVIKENCIFVKGDILSTENVQNALNAGISKWGKLNVVVNCAGTAMSSLIFNRKKDHCCNYNAIQKTVSTNICGTFNVIRLAAQQMANNQISSENKERGVIINTGGIDAFKAGTHGSVNAASFGGISSMTLPISRDLASLGIRVVTVSPGYFKTAMLGVDSIESFFSICNAFPCRLGQANEFAECVESVIKNKMINGEIIQLDAATFLPSFDIN